MLEKDVGPWKFFYNQQVSKKVLTNKQVLKVKTFRQYFADIFVFLIV